MNDRVSKAGRTQVCAAERPRPATTPKISTSKVGMDLAELSATPWTWDTDEAFRPTYWAFATGDGIRYVVYLNGPAGGFGMAGYQSYEALLANGPLNQMPATIEAQIRTHAQQMLGSSGRAALRWELSVDASGLPEAEALAYVSAAIDDTTIAVTTLDADTHLLYEGSLIGGTARLSIVVGFGRPSRLPGARTVSHEFDLECPRGSSTTVTFTVRRDFTIDVTCRRG